MNPPLQSEVTHFTRDVVGRYICNTLDEAKLSADPAVVRPDGRPQIEARDFDLIVIGGGTFGAVVAEHLAFRDRARQHRILVLEGGDRSFCPSMCRTCLFWV